jgi:hypothetical protein
MPKRLSLCLLSILALANISAFMGDVVWADQIAPAQSNEVLSAGTGILVSAQGQILTNNHVVGGCRNIIVWSPAGETSQASLTFADQVNDLALITIDGKFAGDDVARIRTAPPVRSGETVAVFGFPMPDVLSLQGNITQGNISALAGPGDDVRLYQFTAPVQHGNSGGPLLDQAGNVVGIVESRLEDVGGEFPQNVNFAITSSVAASFLQAHDVAFQSAATGEKQDLPLIANMARRFAVLIICVSAEPQAALPSPADPSSALRLHEFEQREQENARHDPMLTTPLRALYDAYMKLTKEDRANAGPLSTKILDFADKIEEANAQLEEFARNVTNVGSDDAFRAYDALTIFDKILYQKIAPDDVFLEVCESEGNLALKIQQEMRLCRDASLVVVVNGVWGQRSLAAARSFLEDARYWGWYKDGIDLTVPSTELLSLVHKVKAESYGPICAPASANLSLPIVNVAELCRRRLRDRLH